MSLGSAFNASVSGIKNHSETIGAVANNVSNMRTKSYKRTLVSFTTLVTPTSANQGSEGLQSVSRRQIDERGVPVPSGVATNFAITGSGFAVVKDSSNKTLFTRLGDFKPNEQNILENTAGHILQGWPTDFQGTPTTANLSSLDELSIVQLPSTFGTPKATSEMNLSVNLPVKKAVGETVTHTETLYDGLGSPHNVLFSWAKTQTNPQQWSLSITSPEASAITKGNAGGTPYSGTTPILVDFNGDGTPSSLNGGTGLPDIYITWSNSASPSTVKLNAGTVNKADGLTALDGPEGVLARSQDGVPVGRFESVSIDNEGIVSVKYSNQTTQKMFKIPLISVTNPQGLAAVSGNAYETTDLSGVPLLQSVGSGVGKIEPGHLEESNVDIAFEFSEMISGQRAFSASTQTFKTANEMFEILDRLIR